MNGGLAGQVLPRYLFGDESLNVYATDIAQRSVTESRQQVAAKKMRIEFLGRELHCGKNGWPPHILNEAIESHCRLRLMSSQR